MQLKLRWNATALCFGLPLFSATYQVGPGQPLAKISNVPWKSLAPGDLVLIYYQPQAYKEKWVICRRGTSAAPITVRGVLGPSGQRPVIIARFG